MMFVHLFAHHHHMPMLLLPIVYLVTLFLTVYAGAKLAKMSGISELIGGLVGLVFHLPGVLFLLAVYAIKTYSQPQPPFPTAPTGTA